VGNGGAAALGFRVGTRFSRATGRDGRWGGIDERWRGDFKPPKKKPRARRGVDGFRSFPVEVGFGKRTQKTGF